MTDEFDIGKRGITVMMDRPRELIFTLGSMRAMEDLGHRWAQKSNIHVPGGILSSGMIISNLGSDSLLSIALWGALRKEDPKMKLEDVDAIYEAYLDNEGDRDDLVGLLVEALARAKNPRKYQEAKELQKVQKEAAKLAQNGPGSEQSGEDMSS